MGGKRNRVLGRCAGILFLTAAVASLPANQLLSAPRPAWWIHLIDLLGALTGAACLLVPWDRISRRWLHLIPPVAVAEIVLSVSALGQHGDVYQWFFILIAVYVGYAFRKRIEVIFHMGVTGLGIVFTAVHASGWLPHEAQTASAALRLADDRMYAAKRAAREAPFVLDFLTAPGAEERPPTARSPSTSR